MKISKRNKMKYKTIQRLQNSPLTSWLWKLVYTKDGYKLIPRFWMEK